MGVGGAPPPTPCRPVPVAGMLDKCKQVVVDLSGREPRSTGRIGNTTEVEEGVPIA